jgi:hypothetical protein
MQLEKLPLPQYPRLSGKRGLYTTRLPKAPETRLWMQNARLLHGKARR